MKRVQALIAIGMLALVASPAVAQDRLSRDVQDQEQIEVNGYSGVTARWGPVVVGGYQGTLMSDPTSPSITLYCVDFANGIAAGDLTDVNTIRVSNDNADLSVTRMRDENNTATGPQEIDSRLMQYRQASYLASMFESYQSLGGIGFDSDADGVDDTTFGTYSNNVRRNTWSGLQAAIWQLMTPGFPVDPAVAGPYVADVNLALAMADPFIKMAQTAAQAGFYGMDFREWSVMTDQNANGATGGMAEVLVRSVAPEPGTVVLLLTGMLFLFGFARKRLTELGDR